MGAGGHPANFPGSAKVWEARGKLLVEGGQARDLRCWGLGENCWAWAVTKRIFRLGEGFGARGKLLGEGGTPVS